MSGFINVCSFIRRAINSSYVLSGSKWVVTDVLMKDALNKGHIFSRVCGAKRVTVSVGKLPSPQNTPSCRHEPNPTETRLGTDLYSHEDVGRNASRRQRMKKMEEEEGRGCEGRERAEEDAGFGQILHFWAEITSSTESLTERYSEEVGQVPREGEEGGERRGGRPAGGMLLVLMRGDIGADQRTLTHPLKRCR